MSVVVSKPKYLLPSGELDISALRKEFPVLSRSIRGKRLVYLDNAATALKPLRVIESIERYYREGTSNIHRGVHLLSEEATGLYESVRVTAREFLNADYEREIVFTTGTTAGINLVARSFVRPRLHPGDEVLITALEHHANIVPWQMICEESGAKLTVAPINDLGELDLIAFERLITARTKFVSVTWISNALGVINPVEAMVDIARRHKVPILIDAAQAVAHASIDVQRLKPDFLVFSGHKLFGPTGVGVLYGRLEHLEAMPPLFGGGDMIKEVSFERTIYADPPARFEAGTPPIADVIALGEAMKFTRDDVGFDAIKRHEDRLLGEATVALADVAGLKVIGASRRKVPIFSFVMDGIHPHDIGSILDQHGIAIRTGHHCAQPLMARLGVSATARASFSVLNSTDDITALIFGLSKVKEIFA